MNGGLDLEVRISTIPQDARKNPDELVRRVVVYDRLVRAAFDDFPQFSGWSGELVYSFLDMDMNDELTRGWEKYVQNKYPGVRRLGRFERDGLEFYNPENLFELPDVVSKCANLTFRTRVSFGRSGGKIADFLNFIYDGVSAFAVGAFGRGDTFGVSRIMLRNPRTGKSASAARNKLEDVRNRSTANSVVRTMRDFCRIAYDSSDYSAVSRYLSGGKYSQDAINLMKATNLKPSDVYIDEPDDDTLLVTVPKGRRLNVRPHVVCDYLDNAGKKHIGFFIEGTLGLCVDGYSCDQQTVDRTVRLFKNKIHSLSLSVSRSECSVVDFTMNSFDEIRITFDKWYMDKKNWWKGAPNTPDLLFNEDDWRKVRSNVPNPRTFKYSLLADY